MRYCSIDIETCGLDRTKHDIIQFAAVLEDTKKPLPLAKLPMFVAYIDQDAYRGDAYALAMHANIFKRIADFRSGKDKPSSLEHFCPLYDLMTAFGNFLGRNDWPFEEKDQKYKVTVAGKNAGNFDIPFLEQHIPKQFWGYVRFRHRDIDPMMLYLDWDQDEIPPDSKLCMERAGVPGDVAHTALADALTVIKLLRKKQGIRVDD